MRAKIRRINKYFIYDVFGAAVYGLILYFGFTWLVGFSLLYAYLWNFALIILAISFDGYTNKFLQSDEAIKLLMKKYSTEKVYSMITGGFITFKTLLYLFYIFILIASQIINFSPSLISGNLVNFIQANDYSVLFLLAFDTLIGQLSKDREKMKKASEKLKNFLIEDQD